LSTELMKNVTMVAFNHEDKFLASGSSDNALRIWDCESGRLLKVLLGHTMPIIKVAFYKNKHRIISISHDKTARIWDIGSEQCFLILPIFSKSIFFINSSISFSSDDHKLCVSEGDSINLYQLEDHFDKLTARLIWKTTSVLSTQEIITN